MDFTFVIKVLTNLIKIYEFTLEIVNLICYNDAKQLNLVKTVKEMSK